MIRSKIQKMIALAIITDTVTLSQTFAHIHLVFHTDTDKQQPIGYLTTVHFSLCEKSGNTLY